jgi:hypothetical protein
MTHPDRPGSSGRSCGIARKLGYTVDCPAGGCALLDALGYDLPRDDREICPVEHLARGDNPVVLWTFDELRREMQRSREQDDVRRDAGDRDAHNADTPHHPS